jgi:hypothetical protein
MNQTITQILERLSALEAVVGQEPVDIVEPEQHLPTAAVARRYHVTIRTIDRWTEDPDLGFPKPAVMNRRKYWSLRELADYDRRRVTMPLRRANKTTTKAHSETEETVS